MKGAWATDKMDKVNKFGSAMSKKLANKKLNKNNQSGGDSLEQIVKTATAKELRAPDSSLNLKVGRLMPGGETEGTGLTGLLEEIC